MFLSILGSFALYPPPEPRTASSAVKKVLDSKKIKKHLIDNVF
jgi:hypothetical protein